ncbi:tyrosine-type recombinase/integrase, partial [Sphingomonadaceae bacterium]|nr:tyrosine-type recombinase/integrase [Sphingomonadaceae bacterium]
MSEIEAESQPVAVAAIRLLALTGCRKSEICFLCWNEVRGRRLLLHDAKTGPRTVWLGKPAQELLSAIPRDTQSDRIFWRKPNGLSLSCLEECFRRTRERAGLPQLRIHDLRHSFASH